MTDRLVCNIYFYLYMRFFFGFYHEFECPKPVRWLARFYCCFICVTTTIWKFHVYNDMFPIFPTLVTVVNYVLYVLISFWNSNKYLLRYYKKSPLIDDDTNAHYPIGLYLNRYLAVLMLFKMIGFLRHMTYNWSQEEPNTFFPFLETWIWCANTTGTSLVLFVVGVLYSRVRSMRKMLERNEFQCRSQGRYHPRRYIQKYIAIMDRLEENDDSTKLQIFVSILSSAAFLSYEILYNLYIIRSDNNFFNMFGISWFLLETALGCSPLLISAIVSDMVTMELQEMLVIIVKRRIACDNERDRAEIQKLFQFLKDRPFQYSMWRVVPLNMASLLSLFTFSITSIVAILQIKDWFK